MRKLLVALALVFGVFALTQTASAQHHGGSHYVRDHVTCESINYNYNQCGSYQVRRIERARIVRQHSKTTCQQGRNWGYDSRSVWVSNGCRGTFEVVGRR